jgi:hypothetical protein
MKVKFWSNMEKARIETKKNRRSWGKGNKKDGTIYSVY